MAILLHNIVKLIKFFQQSLLLCLKYRFSTTLFSPKNMFLPPGQCCSVVERPPMSQEVKIRFPVKAHAWVLGLTTLKSMKTFTLNMFMGWPSTTEQHQLSSLYCSELHIQAPSVAITVVLFMQNSHTKMQHFPQSHPTFYSSHFNNFVICLHYFCHLCLFLSAEFLVLCLWIH